MRWFDILKEDGPPPLIEEDEGSTLAVLGGEKFRDRDLFDSKMDEWVDENGMPSHVMSLERPGVPLFAELWAGQRDIPHSVPKWKRGVGFADEATHFLALPDPHDATDDSGGIDKHIRHAMDSGKPLHMNYTHQAADNPFKVYNANKSTAGGVTMRTESGETPPNIPEPRSELQQVNTRIREIVDKELGVRPNDPAEFVAPHWKRQATAAQEAWDARYKELQEALGIDTTEEPEDEPETEVEDKRPKVARGGRGGKDDGPPSLFGKSISPIEAAWAILKRVTDEDIEDIEDQMDIASNKRKGKTGKEKLPLHETSYWDDSYGASGVGRARIGTGEKQPIPKDYGQIRRIRGQETPPITRPSGHSKPASRSDLQGRHRREAKARAAREAEDQRRLHREKMRENTSFINRYRNQAEAAAKKRWADWERERWYSGQLHGDSPGAGPSSWLRNERQKDLKDWLDAAKAPYHMGLKEPMHHPGSLRTQEDVDLAEQGLPSLPDVALGGHLAPDWLTNRKRDISIGTGSTRGGPTEVPDDVAAALRGEFGDVEHRFEVDDDDDLRQQTHIRAGGEEHQDWKREQEASPHVVPDINELDIYQGQISPEEWNWLQTMFADDPETLDRILRTHGISERPSLRTQGTFTGLPWNESTGFTTGEPMDIAFQMLKGKLYS